MGNLRKNRSKTTKVIPLLCKRFGKRKSGHIKKEFGIIGVQLWFHANGVDESNLSKPNIPESKGIGNSQVLPRNYSKQYEIEIVLREIAEQVAIRLRLIHKKATVVAIHVGFSYEEQMKYIDTSMKVNPTHNTEELTNHVMVLFRRKYTGGAVRNIGIRYDKLTDDSYSVFTLFDDVEAIERREKLEQAVDEIRDSFGYLSIQKANSLMEGSRVKERSKLITEKDLAEELRKKYILNPPEGMTSGDIRYMSVGGLLDMDYFLNDEDTDDVGEEGFYIF